jgi:ABC-2 type transport system permease protein
LSDIRILKFLDPFQSILQKLNIDYAVMRRILEIKLTMDQRRIPTILSQNTNRKIKEGNQFLKSLWIYALYGLLTLPFIFIGDNVMFQMSITAGIAMFILMTSMISDFSYVLLDIRDKVIINTKPVNNRTINAAKFFHIAIYLTLITGAFIAIPAIFFLFKEGFLYFLLFLMKVILIDLLVLAFTALIYMFVLRFFDGEKLKDMINYVQIILAIAVVVGYQIIIRLFDVVELTYQYDFSWWHVLIPPVWFGAPFEMIINQNYSNGIIILSLFALFGPIISIFLYYLSMPSFERNLQKLMEESSTKKKKKRSLNDLMEKIVCFNQEERLFYRFSSIMISRERDFKLKVYPSLGMALVFPLIFLFNNLSYQSWAELEEGKSYLTIYFTNIIIGTVIHMLQYSAKYKGAWIFQTTPIKEHSAVYSATLKAFFVKLYLPMILMLSILYIWIFSFRILPDLAVVIVSAVLLIIISFKMFNNGKFPFTEPIENAQQDGGTTGKIILIMFIVGAFGFFHFLISLIPLLIYCYLVGLIILTIVLWKRTFK